jgi:hypothetical protein
MMDFVKQYESTVRAVLDYLGIAHQDLSIDSPRLERQADTRSLDWEQRYIEIRRSPSSTAAAPATEPKAEPASGKRRQRASILRAASPNEENAPLPLIAYSVERGIEISLEPAPSGRDWMNVALG